MLRTYLFGAAAVLSVFFLLPTAPPFSFPSGSIITVPEGVGLYALAEKLQAEKVIRSSFWFRVAAIVLGGERDMKAGQYFLSRPQNTLTIAWRVFHGDHDIETVKLTIPEGFTVSSIAALFDNKFPFFDRKIFLESAPEGYLFPDTYFIPVTATASSTIKLFRDNFSRQIISILPEIESSNKTLKQVITMASLLEAEVISKEDREIVSGILWKRLAINMPLQVDSEPGTYESVGLPKEPINNPGLVSIEAALRPVSTAYFYFLTDKSGNAHYAKTFDEHKINKAKYLNK